MVHHNLPTLASAVKSLQYELEDEAKGDMDARLYITAGDLAVVLAAVPILQKGDERRPFVRSHVEGIERAAKALWLHSGIGRTRGADEWDKYTDEVRETWRAQARVAIAAFNREKP